MGGSRISKAKSLEPRDKRQGSSKLLSKQAHHHQIQSDRVGSPAGSASLVLKHCIPSSSRSQAINEEVPIDCIISGEFLQLRFRMGRYETRCLGRLPLYAFNHKQAQSTRGGLVKSSNAHVTQSLKQHHDPHRCVGGLPHLFASYLKE